MAIKGRSEQDELYDRVVDRAETTNLIVRPDLSDVATSMRDQLVGWLADTTDVIPWNPNPRFPETL